MTTTLSLEQPDMKRYSPCRSSADVVVTATASSEAWSHADNAATDDAVNASTRPLSVLPVLAGSCLACVVLFSKLPADVDTRRPPAPIFLAVCDSPAGSGCSWPPRPSVPARSSLTCLVKPRLISAACTISLPCSRAAAFSRHLRGGRDTGTWQLPTSAEQRHIRRSFVDCAPETLPLSELCSTWPWATAGRQMHAATARNCCWDATPSISAESDDFKFSRCSATRNDAIVDDAALWSALATLSSAFCERDPSRRSGNGDRSFFWPLLPLRRASSDEDRNRNDPFLSGFRPPAVATFSTSTETVFERRAAGTIFSRFMSTDLDFWSGRLLLAQPKNPSFFAPLATASCDRLRACCSAWRDRWNLRPLTGGWLDCGASTPSAEGNDSEATDFERPSASSCWQFPALCWWLLCLCICNRSFIINRRDLGLDLSLLACVDCEPSMLRAATATVANVHIRLNSTAHRIFTMFTAR